MAKAIYLLRKRINPVQKMDRIWLFLLAFILLIGVLLRFYNLGTESYWIDEMSTIIEGQQGISQLLASGRLDQPPAFYIPFHYWVELFGTEEIATRAFSVLFGIGSIILLYSIGANLFGKSIGLIGAFLMAISEFQIYHSQAARFYTFFEFMALLSFVFLILAMRTKKAVHFGLYGAASILMIYSHVYGLFILAAQNLFFIICEIKHKKLLATWAMCQGFILLGILPYFYPLLFGNGGVQSAIDTNIGGKDVPSFLDLIRTVYRSVFSPRRGRSWESVFVLYAIAGSILALGMVINFIRNRTRIVYIGKEMGTNLLEFPNAKRNLFMLVLWFLCPILLPFIISLLLRPMYEDHYAISASPAIYLLMAICLVSIRKLVPVILSLSVILILIVPGLANYYVTSTHEQWRETALYIEENAQPNEVIVFAPNMGIGIQQRTFDFYYRGNLQGCGLSSDIIDPDAISDALNQCSSGYSRFWAIIPDDEGSQSVERYKSFFLDPSRTGIQLVDETHYAGISIYLFEIGDG